MCSSAAEPDRSTAAYEKKFASAVAKVKDEGRYRVFMNIERIAGKYPQALYHNEVRLLALHLLCLLSVTQFKLNFASIFVKQF